MSKHYKNHFISANYESFNFSKLYNEDKNECYKGILWSNSTNQDYQKGDIVYIYYTNLPDNTRRILLYGEVNDPDCIYDEATKTKGITIVNCRGINPTDKKKFSYENLNSNYQIFNVRGQRYLKEDDENQKRLLDDLNEEIINKNTLSLRQIRYTYFQFKCSFQDFSEVKSKHETFARQNGLSYSVGHHLIKQEFRKYSGTINKLIDDEDNLIMLCPLCHEKIHHGSFKERKKMISYLYEKNQKKYNEIINKIRNVKDDNKETNDNIEWLFLSYLNNAEKNLYFHQEDQ